MGSGPTTREGSARCALGPPPRGGMLGAHAVLVPVKAFGQAKRRMASTLSPTERRSLARQLAEGVLTGAAPLPVAVVCDDREVADWARERRALVVWEPGRGLNGAVEEGVRRLADLGVTRVTVAHADLPFAAGLGALSCHEGVLLVPDRHGDGTNVISVPSRCSFRFSYGPGSFERHRAQGEAAGLTVRVLEHPRWSVDLDWPADLARGTWTSEPPGPGSETAPASR
jgi:2-phospho-L-lactate guanylyltransferase